MQDDRITGSSLVEPPTELRGLKTWLCWKRVPGPNGKVLKVPVCANGSNRHGDQNSDADRAAMVTYAQAFAANRRLQLDGVGMAVLPDLPISVVDFDNCVSPAGDIHPAVAAACEGTYAELSPSGTGVHLFVRGTLGHNRKDTATGQRFGVEVFSSKGYVTFTGNALPDCLLWGHEDTISEPNAALLRILQERFADVPSAKAAPTGVDPIDAIIDQLPPETLPTVRSAVAALPLKRSDDRAKWIEVGLALKDFARRGFEAEAKSEWMTFAARSTKFNREESEAKWRGFDPKSISYRSIFEWAGKEGGWVNPQSTVAAVLAHADEEEADDHAMSDVRISRILADNFAGRFLYEHNGRGWLIYRDGAYQRCSLGEQLEEAKKLGGRILSAAAGQVATLDAAKAAQAMALAKRAMSAGGITSALALAESDPRIAAKPEQFDTDHDLLNARNGVIHLPTGELRSHDPALRMSRQCPVDYLPHAVCPTWLRVLDEVSKGDADWIDYVWRMLGYVLSGHVHEEKLFFWLGIGANGKSLLANVIRRIMGSYAMSVAANFLLVSQREGEAATPTLATLPGARLALANELEAGARLSSQMVKIACSSEAIGARHNYGAPFMFVPTHKVVVRANHKPIISDNDEGIWRRIDLLPFERNFAPDERDTALEEKLMLEAPGILAWMVRGFGEYKRRGLFPSRRVAAASGAYRKESDLLGQWIEDDADCGDLLVCLQSAAYNAYRFWCTDQGVKTTSKKSFTRALAERGVRAGQSGTGDRLRTYTGIALRSQGDDLFAGFEEVQ